MYGPRPIRFPAHWCADYSKYRGFLAGGISTASSLLPFLEHGSAAKTLISHPHNTASYAGYPQVCVSSFLLQFFDSDRVVDMNIACNGKATTFEGGFSTLFKAKLHLHVTAKCLHDGEGILLLL